MLPEYLKDFLKPAKAKPLCDTCGLTKDEHAKARLTHAFAPADRDRWTKNKYRGPKLRVEE